MKTFNLKYILTSIFFLMLVGLYAQQTIYFSDSNKNRNYSVDTDDSPQGTSGSTYDWKVLNGTTDITSTLSITNNTTTANDITVNWGTTPVGTYTLIVKETNNTCEGQEINIIVDIVDLGISINAENTIPICSTDTTDFKITNAPANSKVSYTVNGGTPTSANPITVDAAGEATITVTPTPGDTEIVVTLDSVELFNGVIVPITTTVEAKTQIITVTTSTITYD